MRRVPVVKFDSYFFFFLLLHACIDSFCFAHGHSEATGPHAVATVRACVPRAQRPLLLEGVHVFH